jgi:hypothetical protein
MKALGSLFAFVRPKLTFSALERVQLLAGDLLELLLRRPSDPGR